MDRLPSIISGFTGASDRLGGIAAQILQDRLELLALELREAKIRFVQVLILTCVGVVFFLTGFVLMVLAGLYVLTPPLQLYGLVAAAVASMIAGAAVFIIIRRRLDRNPLAFDQSLAELKKDATCF
ncbi:MAG: phage holin family protein [Desulfobacteraceae bacterium]|jgi:uncharacterized membrane protein YqjE